MFREAHDDPARISIDTLDEDMAPVTELPEGDDDMVDPSEELRRLLREDLEDK